MSFRADEILCFENYCALAVSVYGKKLVCPELAFERMGINVLHERKDIQRYKWTLNGDVLWRDMGALKEAGFSWAEIADYFGLTCSTAMTVYCRAKRWHTGKGGTRRPGFGRRKKADAVDGQGDL